MHTLIVVLAGVALLSALALLGYAFGGAAAVPRVALAFVPLWLVVAAANLWIGVRSAGYSVSDEAPVFVLVFALPGALALLLWWRLH